VSLLVFFACTNLRGWQGLHVSGLASLDKPALVLHGTTLSCFSHGCLYSAQAQSRGDPKVVCEVEDAELR